MNAPSVQDGNVTGALTGSLQEPDLFTYNFGGSTYSPKLDSARLGAQLKRVKELMKDGHWRSLEEISEVTGDQMQSISARLRDFRKIGLIVERRRRGLESRGLFEYRVLGEPGAI